MLRAAREIAALRPAPTVPEDILRDLPELTDMAVWSGVPGKMRVSVGRLIQWARTQPTAPTIPAALIERAREMLPQKGGPQWGTMHALVRDIAALAPKEPRNG